MRRLDELYAGVCEDFAQAGDEKVDEHRQHATILAQLQELKSSTTVRNKYSGLH